DALLALLDELADFLSALPSDLLIELRPVLVPDRLAALPSPELAAFAADLLVEPDAPLVADALAALPAGLGDRHPALSVAASLDHAISPAALLLRRLVRHHFATRRRRPVFLFRLGRRLLAFLDQRADPVPALLADLLVERRPAFGLHRLAALLADLLVEAGAALGLHGVAALLADLLVERPAALRLDRLAALAADLFVTRVPVLVANCLAALAAGLAHAHRALLLARVLLRHSAPLGSVPVQGQSLFASRLQAGDDQLPHALAAEPADLLEELDPPLRFHRQPALPPTFEAAEAPRLADAHRPGGRLLHFACRPFAGVSLVQSGCHLHLPLPSYVVVFHTRTAVS